MATTVEQARRKVFWLQRRLMDRRPRADREHAYYRGDHKLNYASDKFRQYFGKRYKDFADNWVQVVADSPTERMKYQGIRLAGSASDTEADDDLQRVWSMNGCEADSGLGFLGSIITSRSYGLVWGNDDDETTPEICFEDSREAIVEYAGGSRRKRVAGLKLWADEDGTMEYATLYMPDTVWKFERRVYREVLKLEVPVGIDAPGGWMPRQPPEDDTWPIPNPMGIVPLVELPNRPLLAEEPISDVDGVIAMQDAINLLWAHLFTQSDFAALPQRVVLGSDVPEVPILDNNGQEIGRRPIDLNLLHEKRILFVPNSEAKIGEWSAANLASYTGVIELAVGHVAAQTRTPQHYLVGKMANLAADALRAAETGLVKKTEDKQLYMGEGLREINRLVALAQGNKQKAAAAAAGVVLWKNAEMRSEAQLTDSLQKLRSMGFPFQWIAERYGLGPVEVGRLMAMRDAEQQAALLAGFLEPPSVGEPAVQETPPAAEPAAE